MHHAAHRHDHNNHPEVARVLIDRGADIKAVDWYGRAVVGGGRDAHMDVDNATFENSIDRAPFLELIELLLAKGADPNARPKEVPPVRNDFLRVTASLSWVDFTARRRHHRRPGWRRDGD